MGASDASEPSSGLRGGCRDGGSSDDGGADASAEPAGRGRDRSGRAAPASDRGCAVRRNARVGHLQCRQRQSEAVGLLRAAESVQLHRDRADAGKCAELPAVDPDRRAGGAVWRGDDARRRAAGRGLPPVRPLPPVPAGQLSVHRDPGAMAPDRAQDFRRHLSAHDRRGRLLRLSRDLRVRGGHAAEPDQPPDHRRSGRVQPDLSDARRRGDHVAALLAVAARRDHLCGAGQGLQPHLPV